MDDFIKICIECGSSNNIHDHHIIPKILGGTIKVPLCESCHGKVHGLNFQNHGILIKKGLNKAKKNGVKLGRKKGSKIPPTDLLNKHPDIVLNLMDGYSIRDTAKYTGKGFSTVCRIKKILKN